VEKSFKGATPEQLKTATIHLCPTCSTKIVTKGHGKQAKDVLVHTCNTCGSKDAFCCAIKKGSTSTPGM
jgi:DNA-directed RNA polymerase subunit RPC12/RpoP